MITVTLDRHFSSHLGTFGVLTLDGHTWATIEKPWMNNKPFKSCIPTGEYTCKRGYYHRGEYPAFEVTGVRDRTKILIHIANLVSDVVGCIGIGTRSGRLGDHQAVLHSKAAFNEFMALLSGEDEFKLIIRNQGLCLLTT